MSEETTQTEAPKKKKGWPKGKSRARQVPIQAENRVRDVPVERPPLREEPYVYKPEEDEDRLSFDRSIIPDGQDYQWITASIYGQPQPSRLARFQRQGWSPVPSERHDGLFMPRGYKGHIEVDGLILHERPAEYTRQARIYEAKKARNQVAIKEAQFRGGDIPGVTLDTQHKSALGFNKIQSSFERLSIPEE